MRGREREWQIVLDLLRRAGEGRGSALLVDGESGMGKSLLLSEAARAAGSQGFTLAAAAADELGRLVPLRPLLKALGESPGTLAAEAAAPDGPDMRMWLVDRLRARLETRAGAGPVLVSLDDLQWADPVTLLALRTLPWQLASYPLVWLLARSSGEECTDAQRLFDLLEGSGAMRISLPPLSDDAVADLVADALGSVPDAGLLALAAGASGNPFLVAELLGGLRDEHAVTIADGHATLVSAHLPRRIRVVVRQRLEHLSKRTRYLLETAAVLGRSFALEDAAEMLGEPTAALLPPVEEALAAGVLVAPRESMAFRHELVWRAVIDTLPQPVLQALHRQFGEILLGRGGSAIPAAAHLLMGARRGDAQALAGLDRAAAEVLPLSPQTASDLALRALELTHPADPDRFGRSVTAIEALTAAGRLAEAGYLARAVLAQPLPTVAGAQVRCALSSVLCLSGDAAQASVEAERVLAEPHLPDRLRDGAMIAALQALAGLEDTQKAALQAEAILAAPEDHGIDVVVAALIFLALIRWDEGRIMEGLDLSREAVRRASGGSMGARSFHPGLALAARLVDIREVDEAAIVIRAAVDEIEVLGNIVWAAAPGVLRARMDLAAGRLDDAEAEAEAALGIGSALGTHLHTSLTLGVLGTVALRRGDLHAAARQLDRQHAQVAQVAQVAQGGHAFANRQDRVVAAQIAEARDGPKAAVALLADVYADLPEHRWLLIGDPATAAWLVRVALAAGDHGRAAAVAAVADDLAHENPAFPVVTAAADHARGILEQDLTRLERAAGGHTDPWARASAAEDLGVVLTAKNDLRGAIDRLEQGLAGYERTGATRDAARVRRRLRKLGVRRRHWASAQRPITGWASLTDTERITSGLVSQGLTNRQVADQMFVSVHTVAFHLRQVFRKLGIGSRVELTRVAMEQGRDPAPE